MRSSYMNEVRCSMRGFDLLNERKNGEIHYIDEKVVEKYFNELEKCKEGEKTKRETELTERLFNLYTRKTVAGYIFVDDSLENLRILATYNFDTLENRSKFQWSSLVYEYDHRIGNFRYYDVDLHRDYHEDEDKRAWNLKNSPKINHSQISKIKTLIEACSPTQLANLFKLDQSFFFGSFDTGHNNCKLGLYYFLYGKYEEKPSGRTRSILIKKLSMEHLLNFFQIPVPPLDEKNRETGKICGDLIQALLEKLSASQLFEHPNLRARFIEPFFRCGPASHQSTMIRLIQGVHPKRLLGIQDKLISSLQNNNKLPAESKDFIIKELRAQLSLLSTIEEKVKQDATQYLHFLKERVNSHLQTEKFPRSQLISENCLFLCELTEKALSACPPGKEQVLNSLQILLAKLYYSMINRKLPKDEEKKTNNNQKDYRFLCLDLLDKIGDLSDFSTQDLLILGDELRHKEETHHSKKGRTSENPVCKKSFRFFLQVLSEPTSKSADIIDDALTKSLMILKVDDEEINRMAFSVWLKNGKVDISQLIEQESGR